MPIRIPCRCGVSIVASEALAGHDVPCHACGTRIMVPPPASPKGPSTLARSVRSGGSADRCASCQGKLVVRSAREPSTSIRFWFWFGPVGMFALPIACLIRGMTLGFRCSSCGRSSEGPLPAGVRCAISQQRTGLLAASIGYGALVLGCLAIAIVSVATGSVRKEDDAATGEPAARPRASLPDPLPAGDRETRRRALAEMVAAEPNSAETLERLAQLASRDRDPGIRLEAVEALDRGFTDEAILPLGLGTVDADPRVQKAAIAALDRRGLAAWVSLLPRKSFRPVARAKLTEADEAGIEALAAAVIGHADSSVRFAACQLLGEIGPPARNALPALQQVPDSDLQVRRCAESSIRLIEERGR